MLGQLIILNATHDRISCLVQQRCRSSSYISSHLMVNWITKIDSRNKWWFLDELKKIFFPTSSFLTSNTISYRLKLWICTRPKKNCLKHLVIVVNDKWRQFWKLVHIVMSLSLLSYLVVYRLLNSWKVMIAKLVEILQFKRKYGVWVISDNFFWH